jgi:hypothetical protein
LVRAHFSFAARDSFTESVDTQRFVGSRRILDVFAGKDMSFGR